MLTIVVINSVVGDGNVKCIDGYVHNLASGAVSWASDPNRLNNVCL